MFLLAFVTLAIDAHQQVSLSKSNLFLIKLIASTRKPAIPLFNQNGSFGRFLCVVQDFPNLNPAVFMKGMKVVCIFPGNFSQTLPPKLDRQFVGVSRPSFII